MKNLATTLLICLLIVAHSYSQTDCCPYINSITIIPANPTITDTIRIVTSTTTPNLGSEVSYSFNQQADTFNLIGCFYNGLLTALKTYLDTTNIGTLSAGTYHVYYIGKLSNSQTSCSDVDSNFMETSFQVETASGISQVNFNEKIYYPNPTSDLLTIAIDGMKSIYISNLNGEIIKKIQTGTTTISLSGLPAGNYLIKVFSGDNEFISSAHIIRPN